MAHVAGHVLDVGCGAGRHLLWLERRGITATGVDASDQAIKVCQLRECKNVFELDIMSSFEPSMLPQAATITLFGNNVGIGGTFDGACALFRTLGRLAEPEGRVILTGIDIAATENPAHLAYHERNIAAGRRRGEIKMRFEHKGRTGPWIPWYHPEPSEIEEIAASSGWAVITLEILGPGFFWAILKRQT